MHANIDNLKNILKGGGGGASTLVSAAQPQMQLPTTTYDDESGVVKYTRQQLNQLYNANMNRGLNLTTDGGGYFDNILFMFQLYIAFINALTNSANMTASVIFSNESLQETFSIFLANVLNMVLKTNVSNLTPEQLRDLLQKNRPILQEISAIIIDEASQLLVGLSDVCSKIAMDWVENVLPGLVKSAAIGVPSAVEAAIPPLGELVEIINTVTALMASFMKIVGGVQRNANNISQGYSHVKDAYDSLQKIKNLLNQSPSDIVKSATSAVIAPQLSYGAQKYINDRALPRVSAHPSPPTYQRGGGKKMKSRKYLKDPKKFKSYISKLRKKTFKKERELVNSIKELKYIR
jgi:hypothetical protein